MMRANDRCNDARDFRVPQDFAKLIPVHKIYEEARGKSGPMAKKRMGMATTAAAARIVTTLVGPANVESLHRKDTAADPATTRTPRATTSAIRKLSARPRRRRDGADFGFRGGRGSGFFKGGN